MRIELSGEEIYTNREPGLLQMIELSSERRVATSARRLDGRRTLRVFEMNRTIVDYSCGVSSVYFGGNQSADFCVWVNVNGL